MWMSPASPHGAIFNPHEPVSNPIDFQFHPRSSLFSGPGLLAQLHMELLAGILSNPKTLSPQTWTAHLANRLRHEWLPYSGRPAPPFKASRGEEAHDYAELSVSDRQVGLWPELLCISQCLFVFQNHSDSAPVSHFTHPYPF